MESMTGYGESFFTLEETRFLFRARSLNSRFFESTFMFPAELQWLEFRAEELTRSRFRRGKITVHLEVSGDLPRTPVLHREVLGRYQEYMRELTGSKKKFTPETLLQLPGLFNLETLDFRVHSARFEFFLMRALLKMQRERRREGRRLALWVRKKIRHMMRNRKKMEILNRHYGLTKRREIFALLKEIVPESLRTKKTDYTVLLEEFWRQHQDTILQYFQYDITEELERLAVHYDKLLALLSSEEAGRQMDFYLQEIQREINTLAAKTRSTAVNQIAVDTKADIEQLKEQVRNLE